jgi:(2Fe-2S) ferredoxin
MEDLIQAKADLLEKQRSAAKVQRYQIQVGMSSCGIAAGAQDTLEAINRLIVYENLSDVGVVPIGCLGLCALEPIVQVLRPGQPTVTYGKVTPDVARRIITEHIGKGMIVQENAIESV